MTDETHGHDFTSAPRMTSPIFWHFVRKMVPWLGAIAAYLLLATGIVRWDTARIGETRPDFGADLYGMYTQLFFEPTASLPSAPIARLVFWITPVLGVLLLVRGVVRVGASVFDVQERRKLWVKIMTDRMNNHVVVCGLGHVGVRIVESLKKLGVEVVAIERSNAESFGANIERLAVPVLYGDARQDDFLLQAGISRARSIICATDDDFTNLEVAIDAKRENPDIRVVMRVFDQRVATKVGTALAFEETFSSAALAGPLIALRALSEGVLAVYREASGDLRVDMQVPVPEAWVGKAVADLEDAIDARIISIQHGKVAPRRARHDTKIAKGDVVTLDIAAENVSRIRTPPAPASPRPPS